MSSIDAEGQHVGHHAGLLDGRSRPVAVGSRVEVGIESAAVHLHQIQDGRRQFLHHFLCEGAVMKNYTWETHTDATQSGCLGYAQGY